MSELSYEELVEKVNNKLKTNSEFVNYKFGFKEINAWTYWQGFKVRSPRILLLGQDWGALDYKYAQKYFDAIEEMIAKDIDDNEIHYFDKVSESEFEKFATDRNLVELFKILGYQDIKKYRYKDLFFTNLIPGYRSSGKSTGGFKKEWLDKAVWEEFDNLIKILQPTIVICLGEIVYKEVLKHYKEYGREYQRTWSKWSLYLDDFYEENKEIEPVNIGKNYETNCFVFPVAHPGSYGIKARDLESQKKDWERIGEWLEKNKVKNK